MKKTTILCAAMALCGCMSEPKLEATKPWEGHYYTASDIADKAKQIELDEGESIWMMSNYTLKRLLKNAAGK